MNYKQELIKTYNKIAGNYSQRNYNNSLPEEINFFCSLLKGNKIIDLGCGAGRDAVIFSEKGLDYTGVDTSSAMLSEAKKRVPNGNFLEMDFEHTTFKDSTFDGFWASASLLHIPKKELSKTLTEVKRITKKGGVGFIAVKEKTVLDEGNIHEDKYGGINRYFSFYTKEELTKVLELNGFKITKASTITENDEAKTKWLCFFVEV